MSTIASQITSLTAVYSTVYSDAHQRKHQSSASLAFVWGIHRDRRIPRTKGQLRGKCFHFMTSSWGTDAKSCCVWSMWRVHYSGHRTRRYTTGTLIKPFTAQPSQGGRHHRISRSHYLNHFAFAHYIDVTMGAMASQFTASPLFTQPFIRAQIKENIKAPRHWPLCGEFTGDRWIPRTNGQ